MKSLTGRVYIDVPPIPVLKFAATSFPFAAPAANRFYALGVCDFGMISLVHNATNGTPPSFTLYAWSDIYQGWITVGTAASLTSGVLTTFKIQDNVPIYVAASAALTGATSVVALGGVTYQGNAFVPSAEV